MEEAMILQVIVSVVASTIVGMGAAYFTAAKAMTALTERVKTLEAQADSMADVRERMVRLETKIDLLLGGRLKGVDRD